MYRQDSPKDVGGDEGGRVVGKGDTRRPKDISDKEFTKRWEDTFKSSPLPVPLHASNLLTAHGKTDCTHLHMAEEEE